MWFVALTLGVQRSLAAQSAADAERLTALGARNVQVAGSLKFDVEPDEMKVAAGREWRASLRRPVVLLASTREGEEELLLKDTTMDALIVVQDGRALCRRLRDIRRSDQVVTGMRGIEAL